MNTRLALSAAAAAASAAALLLRRSRPYGFEGRTALITGGSRGLGLLLARELAREGARLALVARDRAALERAAEELRERGAQVLIQVADVRVREQVEEAVRRAEAELGPVEVLVNNAGVIQAGPVEHMSLEDFEESLDVHFWGPLY
ncbi:MAG TPA: SDR family NAD(P)-dependent oxidoreductase, partial [Vicinamibacteria bacterium]